MIKRTLLCALLLFFLYAFFIARIRPQMSISQHQWQENVIKAEKYLYEADSVQDVIVGSSLSCRLIMDSLPHMYNLGLIGQGSFDGLQIMIQNNKFPANVFIETNLFIKEEDKGFTSYVNQPFLSRAKRVLMSLRTDKQPLAYLGMRMDMSVTNPFLSLLHVTKHQSVPVEQTTDNDLFNKLIAYQKKNYAHVPDPTVLTSGFNRMQECIALLKSKHVHVIFFEMPVRKELCNLPAATTIRNKMQEYFPANEYQYIPLDDCTQYETSDGVHLNPADAIRYTKYFKEQVDRFIQK